MIDADFRYTAELEAMQERRPALKSVEPENLRIFLAGFMMGQESQIDELKRKLTAARLALVKAIGR